MTIMTYCPEKHIQEVIQQHSYDIRAFAYIYHDKFSSEELGDKDHKEPHYHIVLRLNTPHSESSISKWFIYYNSDGLLQKCQCFCTYDVYSSFDYLIHKHNPEKYQYSLDDVVVSAMKFFTRSIDTFSDDNALNALDDLMSGIDLYTLARRYGRDVIYHLSLLEYYAFKIKKQNGTLTEYDELLF